MRFIDSSRPSCIEKNFKKAGKSLSNHEGEDAAIGEYVSAALKDLRILFAIYRGCEKLSRWWGIMITSFDCSPNAFRYMSTNLSQV